MNFEDEEYVRLYTRDTVTMKRIGWEGRTVLWHLMRKVEGSGVLELDAGDDAAEAVAALCDLSEELARTGLERLASRGVTELHGSSLVLVKFVEAQNARRSDRLRAQDYRDRKRANSPDETDESLRSVTDRHDSSPLSLSLSLPVPLPKIRSDGPGGPDIAKSDLDSFAPDPKALKQAKTPKKPGWRRFPVAFLPDDSHRKLAQQLGVSLAAELEAIRDHEFVKPKTDPAATLRTWLRNAAKFRRAGSFFADEQGGAPTKLATLADIDRLLGADQPDPGLS